VRPVSTELMGIPRMALFRIPVEAGKDLLAMLPKKEAAEVNSRAQAAHLSAGLYLADLIKRALEN
jgi:hypothetical protein